jgi:signal transduction histidine kinase/DNA-binding NarL/FixJ family response regulator
MADTPDTGSQPGRVHVLVLDDREIPREVLAEVLTHRGHAARACATLEEALAVLDETPPGQQYEYAFVDLCLEPGDLGSPHPSGLGAIRAISERSPYTSVIAFSAADEREDREGLEQLAMDAGADGYLTKGFESLGELVDRMMERFTFLREFHQRLASYQDERDPMVQALHQLGVGVAIIDRHFRVWYINETLRRDLGCAADDAPQARGRPSCFSVFHGAGALAPCLGCHVTAVLRHGGERQRLALVRVVRRAEDGTGEPTLRYFQTTVKPILSLKDPAHALAVLETAQDITDTLRVAGMNRRVRLELLAQAVCDLGYSRCRIYEREEGTSQKLRLAVFIGGDPSLAGQEIELEKSHAARKRGQWEQGAAWWPPGYEREPWHEELGLPEDHNGWVDWPVFSRSGGLLGWIAADTAPVPPELDPWADCGGNPHVGRRVCAEDLEPLRLYADHAARVLSARDDKPAVVFDREAAVVAGLDSRVLVDSPSPSTAGEWVLEALSSNLRGLIHANLRYISEWTGSAVLLAGHGPLTPYVEAEVSLYDIRQAAPRVWASRRPRLYHVVPDAATPDSVEWPGAVNPLLGEAFARYGVRYVATYPVVERETPVGTLSLYLSGAEALAPEGARWLLDRLLERARGATTAARVRDRIRDEAIERAMPDLLPAIAHKLGTPLFLINREVRAWSRGVEAGTATVKEADESIRAISRHLDRIDHIRRDFLHLVSAGTSEQTRLDLVEVVRSAVRDASAGVGAQFVVDYRGMPESAWIHASPQDLSEVFYELTANAIKALEGNGRLTIAIEGFPPGVREMTAWRVTFENSGLIPEDDKSRIFDPFRTSRLASGVGLGLPLIRRLMRANGGLVREVGVDSVVFELLVPALRDGARDQGG